MGTIWDCIKNSKLGPRDNLTIEAEFRHWAQRESDRWERSGWQYPETYVEWRDLVYKVAAARGLPIDEYAKGKPTSYYIHEDILKWLESQAAPADEVTMGKREFAVHATPYARSSKDITDYRLGVVMEGVQNGEYKGVSISGKHKVKINLSLTDFPHLRQSGG